MRSRGAGRSARGAPGDPTGFFLKDENRENDSDMRQSAWDGRLGPTVARVIASSAATATAAQRLRLPATAATVCRRGTHDAHQGQYV